MHLNIEITEVWILFCSGFKTVLYRYCILLQQWDPLLLTDEVKLCLENFVYDLYFFYPVPLIILSWFVKAIQMYLRRIQILVSFSSYVIYKRFCWRKHEDRAMHLDLKTEKTQFIIHAHAALYCAVVFQTKKSVKL